AINTGIGFFDHMLDLFGRHGLFDLEVVAQGDLQVDFHHTVEDVGICLGEAIRKALGDKHGIRRYGSSSIPMDEALASVSLDLSGRSFLALFNPMEDKSAGNFSLDLVRVFFQALSDRSAMTLHATVESAQNPHHTAEALFKALSRALRQAIELDQRVLGVPSTKGLLE
ncbi:MAG: imidazoleglycerol-phosphate dehydratase HisB, partial [Syntrophaceae bacterium]|nr:imidazoleglycerol-phosphate dehydratase HisB [Syntrophaceae bacterium]